MAATVTVLESDLRQLLTDKQHLEQQRDDLQARCNAYQEEVRAQRRTIDNLKLDLLLR